MKDKINELIIKASSDCTGLVRKGLEELNTSDEGMATAEYAIVLVAATSFAGVLVALFKSDAVRSIVTNLITDALSIV
ncbi:DUF4244 domain-containing protein [Alloscardovia criceti]|uniref:DUF4244 domain-containing protein n=1 Tax=Alloscardovia criceti TaxID=356828 RepID=UPI000378F1ED|nr:DUF4244 domain-containing protein [Alloscardovia criceti]